MLEDPVSCAFPDVERLTVSGIYEALNVRADLFKNNLWEGRSVEGLIAHSTRSIFGDCFLPTSRIV
jgi:hypothetical protein